MPNDNATPIPEAIWLCGQQGDDADAVRAAICDRALDSYTAPGAHVLLIPADPLLVRTVHAQSRSIAAAGRTVTARTRPALAFHTPRQRLKPSSLRHVARDVFSALRAGGLLVTTARLTDDAGLGRVVSLVENTGLMYLQHVVAIRVPLIDDALVSRRRDRRDHIDVLVFRKPEPTW